MGGRVLFMRRSITFAAYEVMASVKFCEFSESLSLWLEIVCVRSLWVGNATSHDPKITFATVRNGAPRYRLFLTLRYSQIIVEDYLPRVIAPEALEDMKGDDPEARKDNYLLYTADKRSTFLREFVAATYRFGHSMVRTAYRLNANLDNRFSIFPASDDPTTTAGADSLLGFYPVTNNQVIDSWGRFFPEKLPGELPSEPRDQSADKTKTVGNACNLPIKSIRPWSIHWQFCRGMRLPGKIPLNKRKPKSGRFPIQSGNLHVLPWHC